MMKIEGEELLSRTANPGNGWQEWGRYVLMELKRLNICYAELDTKVDRLTTALTALQVKMALIGGLAGLVVGGAISLVVKLVAG